MTTEAPKKTQAPKPPVTLSQDDKPETPNVPAAESAVTLSEGLVNEKHGIYQVNN